MCTLRRRLLLLRNYSSRQLPLLEHRKLLLPPSKTSSGRKRWPSCRVRLLPLCLINLLFSLPLVPTLRKKRRKSGKKSWRKDWSLNQQVPRTRNQKEKMKKKLSPPSTVSSLYSWTETIPSKLLLLSFLLLLNLMRFKCWCALISTICLLLTNLLVFQRLVQSSSPPTIPGP